jgi:hypothetical protein
MIRGAYTRREERLGSSGGAGEADVTERVPGTWFKRVGGGGSGMFGAGGEDGGGGELGRRVNPEPERVTTEEGGATSKGWG